MNVTLEIDDELWQKVRQRTLDIDLPLSAWVSQLIQEEIEGPRGANKSLAERIGMDDDCDLMEFIPDRKDI